MTHILATFDISKALDEKGREIEPEIDYNDGAMSLPRPFDCRFVPRSPEALRLIKTNRTNFPTGSRPIFRKHAKVERIVIHCKDSKHHQGKIYGERIITGFTDRQLNLVLAVLEKKQLSTGTDHIGTSIDCTSLNRESQRKRTRIHYMTAYHERYLQQTTQLVLVLYTCFGMDETSLISNGTIASNENVVSYFIAWNYIA
ncbi:hypothetical protein MPER_00922 [Moniliophthora perniciosa FA553]|nr:hypothetical protein MPER_00922 [Moniliophthora perniciosa FA553]